MSDFASASMVRVLIEGMRLLKMTVPQVSGAVPSGIATVPLDAKRALIQCAVAQGGIGNLVYLGQGLKRFMHEPSHRALCSSSSPVELLDRWLRLERYVHSKHRTRVLSMGGNSCVVRHESQIGRAHV